MSDSEAADDIFLSSLPDVTSNCSSSSSLFLVRVASACKDAALLLFGELG